MAACKCAMSARAASSISAPPVSWRQAVLPVTDGDNGTLPHEPHRKTAVSLDGDPETMLWPPMRRVSGRLSNAVRQERKVWRDYSSRPRLSLLPSAEKGVVLMRRMSAELCNCRPKPGRCPKRFHHAIECSVPDLTDPSLKEPVDQLQAVFLTV